MATRLLDIVTHCWSGQDVSIYHLLLKMQIRSLISASRKLKFAVRLSVVFTYNDEKTTNIIEEISSARLPFFEIVKFPLPEENLFRRAIGRNLVARSTPADIVWFTDCDHLFTERCLNDTMYHFDYIKDEVDMVWPTHIKISTSHKNGDELIRLEEDCGWTPLSINEKNFHVRKERKAIGGLQIVMGDYCRTHGYLNNTRWVKPVTSDHFLSCKCDVPFRRNIDPDRKIPVLINDLYRVRHSRTGRDKGKKYHGRKTDIKLD